MSETLTQKRLKVLLDYDEQTGIFVWRSRQGRKSAGTVAGSINYKGYVVIGVDGAVYRAHRLAWLYVYGKWPSKAIDHIDGSKTNNQIKNLRDVSIEVNSQNQHAATKQNKSSGLLGVSRQNARKKWRAMIWVKGKCLHIGYFHSPEEAHQAYIAAKKEKHLGFVQKNSEML